MHIRRIIVSLLFLVLVGPELATAQGMQSVQDDEVGVGLAIPKGWQWRKRESTKYQRASLFINCMPEITRNYPCALIVEYFAASPNQSAITDGDRRKWESAYSASGLRKIRSMRDVKVASYFAFEIVGQEGNQPNSTRSRDTYVLVPSAGRVFRLSFMGDDKDIYALYLPAIDAALQSFTSVAKSTASPKGQK
jgi:hypothetical protein